MGYSNTNIKIRTAIILSIITVFVVFGVIIYNNNTMANDIEINDKQVVLTYPKKSITLDYVAIDEVKIACADKGGGCGLVIYTADKKYHTNHFTTSDNAKRLRDDINGRIERL